MSVIKKSKKSIDRERRGNKIKRTLKKHHGISICQYYVIERLKVLITTATFYV